MTRINGVASEEAGLFTKTVYRMTKKKEGRVIEPIRVTAHHSRILMGMGAMELAQEKAVSVESPLKLLAQIKVATLIGCPF